MVGITLSPEQIRSAPPEVRRWLEHEVASALGFASHGGSDAVASRSIRLADLTAQEAPSVFALLQADYLACQVLFELAREMPNSRSGDGLRAFSIAEIARHTRLGHVERLVACFGAINAAFQRVRGDGEATLFGFDQLGCCYVSEATHQAVRELWQTLAGPQPAGTASPRDEAGVPLAPASVPVRPQPATTQPVTPQSAAPVQFAYGELPQEAAGMR